MSLGDGIKSDLGLRILKCDDVFPHHRLGKSVRSEVARDFSKGS
jgi:hypothetical protein